MSFSIPLTKELLSQLSGQFALLCADTDCLQPITDAELVFPAGPEKAVLNCTCSAGHRSVLEASFGHLKIQPPQRTMRTKAAGVTFENSDGTSRQELLKHVQRGDRLAIERHMGRRGVMYMLKHPLGIIGSVPAATLSDFKALNPGSGCVCKVAQITGGTEGKSFVGCNIELIPDSGPESQDLDALISTPAKAPASSHSKKPAWEPAKPAFVYMDPNSRVYHADKHCSGLKSAVPYKLYIAAGRMGGRPCKKCGAPAYPSDTASKKG